MANDIFQKIEKDRANILLAEMGAMIHNLGKMSKEHLIELKTELHLYFGDWLYDLLNGNPSLQADRNWQSHWNKAKEAHGKFYPDSFKSLLQTTTIKFDQSPLNDREYHLREFSTLRKRDLYQNDKLTNLVGATSILGRLLAEAHGMAAGGDKGFVLQTEVNQQNPHLMHLSSPFGYELENLSKRQIEIEKDCLLLNLRTILVQIIDHLKIKNAGDVNFWIEIRKKFLDTLKDSISIYIADTRYPVNDVDLFGFHHATASFFKAGIAKLLIEGKSVQYEDIGKMKWRLLSIRYNGLDYIMRARGVSDMLAKKQALENTLNEIKNYLEVELLIANEVYRDENGVVYLFPDLDGDKLQDIRNDIVEKVYSFFRSKTTEKISRLDGDINPAIDISAPSRQALMIGQIIKDKTPAFNQCFENLKPGKSKITIDGEKVTVDLCQSCNLRFIASGLKKDEQKRKAYARKLCGVCYHRRDRRAAQWWKEERDTTIWMDEVADEYGQLALIVGKFELEHWLDGFYLNSMLLNTIKVLKEKSSDITDYWDIVNKFQELIDKKGKALGEIKGKHKPLFNLIKANFSNLPITDRYLKENKKVRDLINDIVKNDPYEIFDQKKDGRSLFIISNAQKPSFARLARIWQYTKKFNDSIPEMMQTCFHSRRQQRYFIEATDESKDSGLDKTFKSTHIYEFKAGNTSFSLYCVKGSENGNKKLEFVSAVNWDYYKQAFNFDPEQKLTKRTELFATEGNRQLKIKISSRKTANDWYYPLINILTEPQMFMLLVPASRAIEVVDMIKKEYEAQFSKVKNRLPLNLGIVFAKRRQPLYTILEAGRKMMNGMKSAPVVWQVRDDACLHEKEKSVTVQFEHAPRNEQDDFAQTLKWQVKADLAKQGAIDYYYPYFYTTYKDTKDVQDRSNVFLAPLPEQNEDGKQSYDWAYACHVSELKDNDRVYITPSFFDFEFLEVPGRRFDIYYEQNRRILRQSRPFLLDELEQIERVWQTVSNGKLTSAQLRGILDVIERRREEWLQDKLPDAHFKEFVRHTLYAGAKEWLESLNESDRKLIIDYAQNGRLLDVHELYMKILKHKLED